MPKQLNVDLNFTANTSQVKTQLQDLQNSLTKLTMTTQSKSPLGLTKEVSSAIGEVTKLQAVLQKSTTSAGKLDLGQFHNELNKANLDAQKIGKTLLGLGPEGQAAFSKLAQSVSSAEVPLRRTSTLLQEFKTTLANTARWQVSSTLLHGFMGSIQTAYHYAQDLNESLNNIRIVTGQSTDQMADFAKSANESAKALSTTTTEYTDAALIFYQQGLNDEQVKERTDVTIKMANVSRQSAEEVSDQMTAVWNNFNKSGDESAEHFADVMTKLGAETASSSSEIAQGLEKFAGIADTIGLSFDYASSALATITATSRETPEVVGTALKTIFARIQGLKLGGTLEDGTDLNKYSEGLAKVGINIKDATGEMKAADVIIDEMGAKWKQLSKDQQMALAQTVAGTRQYNQLVTLMDNFDFFEENVQRAKDSEGTLQEQADIYAESWEAARDRVKASLESVYQDLLNDDFFIGLTNVTATVIDGLDNMIKTMGGIPGVVSNLGNVFLTVFKKDIASAIDSAKYNLELFSEKGRNAIIERRKSFNDELVEMSATSAESEGFEGLPDLYREQGAAQNELIEKKVRLEAVNAEINEQDQIALQLLEQQTNALIEQYKIKSQNVKNAKENVNEATTNAIVDIGAKNFGNKGWYQNDEQYQKQLNKAIANEKAFSKILITINKVRTALSQPISTEEISKSLGNFIEQLELSEDEMKDMDVGVRDLWNKLKELKNNPAPEAINEIQKSLLNLKQHAIGVESIDHLIKKIEEVGGSGSKQAVSTLRQLQQAIKQESVAIAEQGQAMTDASAKIEAYKQKIQTVQQQYATFGQKAVGVAQGISTISMAISSLVGIWNTINDDSISWPEKILSILTSLGFVIPNIISGVKGIRDVLLATSAAEKIVAADGTIMWTALLGPIAVVIAGIAAVAAAIYGLVKGYEVVHATSPEGKFEEASESAKTMSQSLQDVTEDVKNINTALDQLTSGINTLDSLAKGTKDWKAQLAEVSTQIAKILEEYPELSQYINVSKSGYSLDEQGLQKYKDLQSDRQIAASNAALNAQARKIETKAVKDLYDNYLKDNVGGKFIDDIEKFTGIIANFGGTNIANQSYTPIAQRFSEALYKEIEKGGIKTQGKFSSNEGISNKYVDIEQIRRIAQEAYGSVTTETLNKTAENLEKMEKVILEQGSNIDKINKLNDNQLLARGNELGSTRDAEDLRKLLGTDYNTFLNKRAEQLEKDFIALDKTNRGWNKTRDYSGEQEEKINETLQKYLGADTKYKGQEDGNVVYTKGESEEEKSLSKDDFFRIQAELNIEDSFKTTIVEGIKNELDKIGINTIDLSEAQIIGLDNAKQAITERLSSLPGLKLNIFSGTLDEFSLVTKTLDEAGMSLNDFSTKMAGINWDSNQDVLEFTNSINELVSKKIDLEEFTNTLDKLNASKALEDKASELQSFAESLGYNKKETAELSDALLEQGRVIQEYATESDELDDSLSKNADATVDVVKSIAKMNKGIEDLHEGADEWISAIRNVAEANDKNAKSTARMSEEYAEAAIGIKKSLSNILGVEEDLISHKFIENHIDEIEQAAQGSEEAIDSLRVAMAEDIVLNLKIDQSFKDQLSFDLLFLQQSLPELEIGATIREIDGGDAFIDSLNNLIDSTGIAQDTITSILSAMGYTAEFENTNQQAVTQIPEYTTYTVPSIQSEVEYTAGVNADGTPLKAKVQAMKTTSWTEQTGQHEAVNSYPVPSMGIITDDGKGGGAKAPHISNITKAPTASMNNYSSGNSGGKGLKESKGKGGGGGGSSAKPKEAQHKDHKDPIKEIADRYHDLKKAIEDVEHVMSMLSKTQDHLAGSALAKSLKEQNKLLEQQKGNYQALNNELRKEQGELQNILGFLGGSFDAYGGILNYADVFNNIQNAYNESVNSYNQTIDWFNSLSGDEQEEFGKSGVEFAEKMLEQVKKDYDEANKYLSRYDEVYSELQKNDEKLQELLYQQIENNLKIFEVEIQVKLDISEAQRKVNDFLRDIRKNFRTLYTETEDWAELFTTAIKDANTLAGAEGTINTRLRQIQEVRSALDNPGYNYNSNMSLFVDRSEAIDKLKEYTEELMSESEDLYNLYEDSWNSYLDAMDEALDQWDDILEGFEDINDTLDHYEKVAEMLYGGEDAAAGRRLLESLYNMSATNSLGAQTALRAELDSLNKELSELYARGALDGEQDIEKLKETIREKTHELESEQEHFLEVIQNRLLNSIKTIIDTADKALTRGFGGNKIVERWNDAKEAAEGYYDEIERVYQLENLESKWEKAINDASTIKNQQYLKTLMDNQLSNLRSKTKLSEYNITLAEKELAIYQAQMALEDARNNKNTMKLVRNEQGDWTYQYVADEEDINAKEEELLNAMYDKYEYVKQSSADATEAILDLYNTANEKLSELMQEYTNADEERRAELAEEYDYWYNYYWGEDGLIVQKVAEAQDMETDLQTAGMETLWQLYEQDKDNFDLMTQVEKDLITELKEHGVDSLKTLELERDDFYKSTQQQTKEVIDITRSQWDNMARSIIGQWNTNPDSVRANIQSAYNQIMAKVDEYDQAIIKSEFISGMALADVEGQLSRVGDKIQDNIYKIDDMTNKTDQLSTFREYVDLVGFAWYGVRNAIEEATSALDRYLRMLNGEDTSGGGGGPAPDAGPADGGGNAGGGGGGELSAEEWAALGETVALGIAQNIYTYGSWGDEPVRHDRITERYGEEMANRVQEIINELYRSGNTGFLYNPDSSIWGFATGGYTGDWDGKGRLALLHQKELVLNEKDTENILDAVNIVRTIKDSIGSMVSSITNLAPESIAAASNVNNSDKKVFNITAEFPNANNVTEIQEAILGLPNLASQWMSANG